MPLFITSYMVAGDNCQGAYLVNAETKKAANAIVKSYDKDYVRVRSSSKADMDKEDEGAFDNMIDGKEIPSKDKATSLWSGT
jgi:hypothetical protein